MVIISVALKFKIHILAKRLEKIFLLMLAGEDIFCFSCNYIYIHLINEQCLHEHVTFLFFLSCYVCINIRCVTELHFKIIMSKNISKLIT